MLSSDDMDKTPQFSWQHFQKLFAIAFDLEMIESDWNEVIQLALLPGEGIEPNFPHS